MSILESQYLRPAILFALAIPLLIYDFSSVNWVVLIRPVDVSQPVVISETFRVPRDGPYIVEFGITGHADDCVWGVIGAQCDNSHRQFEADWKVTEGARVVLDGHSASGFLGTWTTEGGGSGVSLGSFAGLIGNQYELSLAIHSPAPDLVARKPRVSVEAGQKQRDTDMLQHAGAFLVSMLLLVGSVVVATHTARKRSMQSR